MSDRPELAKREGLRSRYTGTVERLGIKRSYGREKSTLLLRDVRTIDGILVTDHLWFTCGKWSDEIMIGDRIAFDARATSYEKGYAGDRWDVIAEHGHGASTSHRLSNPTRVDVLTRAGSLRLGPGVEMVGDDGLEPPTSSL
jgi:hypothetical protein